MAVQTTYSAEHAPAYEGMKSSSSELFNSRSYFAEGGNILPGRWVVSGTNAQKQVQLPGASSDDAAIMGLTLYELNRVHSDDGIPQNEDRPLTVVNHRTMWVIAIDGASVGDPVYAVRSAAWGAAGGTRAGAHGTAAGNTETVTTRADLSPAA